MEQQDFYGRLGVRHGINARGAYTDLGGGALSPSVWNLMAQANRDFAEMPELLRASGERIAVLMGAEAARVVPGASAGIVLAVAAAITEGDGLSAETLPETTGMRTGIIIQRLHRYKYDRMVRISGGDLIEIGNEMETTSSDLLSAIDDRAAAVFYSAHLEDEKGALPLDKTLSIAHDAGLPVIVDAAYLIDPVERMRSYTDLGADAVIFSSKYMAGPNGGGFVVGTKDFIDRIAAVDFTDFESGDYLLFGRPFKLDRWTVAGVVGSLEEWLSLSRSDRLGAYEQAVKNMAEPLQDEEAIKVTPAHFTMEEDVTTEGPTNCLIVQVVPAARFTAQALFEALRDGQPAVFSHLRDNTLIFDVEAMADQRDSEVVARRVKEELRHLGTDRSLPEGVGE